MFYVYVSISMCLCLCVYICVSISMCLLHAASKFPYLVFVPVFLRVWFSMCRGCSLTAPPAPALLHPLHPPHLNCYTHCTPRTCLAARPPLLPRHFTSTYQGPTGKGAGESVGVEFVTVPTKLEGLSGRAGAALSAGIYVVVYLFALSAGIYVVGYLFANVYLSSYVSSYVSSCV